MKGLDPVTVSAVAQVIEQRYQTYVTPFTSYPTPIEVGRFFVRAGITMSEQVLAPLRQGALDSGTQILNQINGTPDFERVLRRLASPIEYGGVRRRHDRTLRKINEILWAEGLEIVMDGPNPVIRDLETSEPESTQVVNDNPASPDPVQQPVTNTSNEIFVVHGRDLGAKDTVARFLGQIGVRPVILREIPDEGNTVIEKFERHADRVRFAVVLFTPDDKGALSGEIDSANPRPRQNVVFELGYFIGKLGRDRVRVLDKGEVEILSDYSGVIRIPMDDNDGWKLRLVQELQSARYNVDANDVLHSPATPSPVPSNGFIASVPVINKMPDADPTPPTSVTHYTDAGREFLSNHSTNPDSSSKHQLRAFITHGKNRDYIADTQDVCRQLGIEPVLAIESSNLSRSVEDKVAQGMASCDIYIALLTKDEGDEPSQNAIGELTHAAFSHRDRVIIFRERGVELPTNLGGRATGWLDGHWKFDLLQELEKLISQVTQE